MMQQRLDALASAAFGVLQAGEDATVSFAGEQTDFARLNAGGVRQAGSVDQSDVTVRLLQGRRHASRTLTLAGVGDEARVAAAVADLRQLLPLVPEDPHLRSMRNPRRPRSWGRSRWRRPWPRCWTWQPRGQPARPRDSTVGSDAGLRRPGASAPGSSGERGRWILPRPCGDKAVKRTVSGLDWAPQRVRHALDTARHELVALGRPVKTIAPGEYRAWLAPAAVDEVWSLLRREFGERGRRTRTASILPAVEGSQCFSPLVSARESVATGVAPGFSGDGWPRPDAVELIRKGEVVGSLVSSRSAQEYGLPCNGAATWESAEALELDPGTLAEADVLSTLGTGLRISDLWYLNYSDRQKCRVTGMTRFATFWVEDGEIAAPLQVMRFDDSAIRLFGDGLVALGAESELGMSTSTYFRRATGSTRVPGALVDGFRFTL